MNPGVGQLRLRELSVPAVDRFLRVVKEKNGGPTGEGMPFGPLRHGGLGASPRGYDHEPDPGVAPISVKKKAARALTVAETTELITKVRADPDAMRLDVVDLVEFMIGSGVRIGEACALRAPQVDLENGTIEVSATVTDFGLEERPKTKAGWRVIAIPPNVVEILRRRLVAPEIATDVALFPSQIGRIRDSSNTAADHAGSWIPQDSNGSQATHSAKPSQLGQMRPASQRVKSPTTSVTRSQA